LSPVNLYRPSSFFLQKEGRGEKPVRFEKKINGTLVVVEIVPFKGGTMQFKTAWKRPSEKIDAVPLNHTPEAVLSPSHSIGHYK